MAKKTYIPPSAEKLTARIERGYQISGCRTLVMGSEGTTDNAHIEFGGTDPYNNGTDVEDVGFGGHIFF